MEYKYFAFISYNSRDIKWGKQLQRKLESYRMPTQLCSEYGIKKKRPIRPVFFAPTDIQPGGLSDELKQRLTDSRYLIVICSPNSARSEWVGKEIAYFHSLGRAENIHLFIVDGTPNSGNPDTECFNPVLKQLDIPELLGVNIHERIHRLPWLNKERAYIQLITKLLGVDFDVLWNRHKRLLIRRTILWSIGIVAVVAAFIAMSFALRPVSVGVSLNELTPNRSLPPLRDAKVTLVLENETKEALFTSVDDAVTLENIPARMIGKRARIVFESPDYLPLDTVVVLDKAMCLNIYRDPEAFGHLQFTLYDSNVIPQPGVVVYVEDMAATTDADGAVELYVPIGKQRTLYRLHSDIALADSLLDARCTRSTAVFTIK